MNTFEPASFLILVVDDIPKNIQVVGSLLRDQKYRVEYAMNGSDALSMVKKHRFDLLLLDIMMPGMAGTEVCREIRHDTSYDNLPVIFLTAKTEKESILEGFEAGGQDYITKPFDGPELLARVRTQLELKSYRDRQKELNQWLEKRVQERTMELNESNRKLEKANDELKTLDAAKGEFLRLISHEIRTPLNGILGFTQLLKDELKSAEVSEWIHLLDLSARRLEKFSYVALQITELKTKKKALKREPVPMIRLIEEVTESLREEIRARNIRLAVEGNANEIHLSGEKHLLSTCFESLLDNAIKYSSDGGQITFRLDNAEERTTCELVDEGTGFSEAALKNLFHFFNPGEQHVDQNMGLDLALAKLIVDAHDGSIDVRNNDDKGATVRLSFRKT